MANTQDELTGTWHCRYWYPNTKHDDREDISEYTVQIDQEGGALVFHSLHGRNETPGSHIEGRFTVDGPVVTGTWHEDTSPSGDWEGMTYKGAFQLLRDANEPKLSGLWVAAGYNNGNPKVFTGRWEFVRADAA